MRKGSGRETSQRTAALLDSQGKPLIQCGLRQLTSSSSTSVDYSERKVTNGSGSTFRRQVLERYPHVREDHLRYMQKWGLIRPEPRGEAAAYSFQDLAVVRQADEMLAEGMSFRALLRKLVASRSGQLAFDFRIEAQPAKVLQLTRREAPPLNAFPALSRNMAAEGSTLRPGQLELAARTLGQVPSRATSRASSLASNPGSASRSW
jgi:hypothetical protein